jgi:hypothetical protein
MSAGVVRFVHVKASGEVIASVVALVSVPVAMTLLLPPVATHTANKLFHEPVVRCVHVTPVGDVKIRFDAGDAVSSTAAINRLRNADHATPRQIEPAAALSVPSDQVVPLSEYSTSLVLPVPTATYRPNVAE